MNAETTVAVRAPRKPYRGPAMEGFVARWYTKITKGEARQYRACAEAVAAEVPDGGRILDLAAGPGWLAIELAKLGRHRVSGLDISRTFVQIATDHASAAGVSVDFHEGDAGRMPFPDASFDFVVCRAAFKNFTDPVGVLDEIHRVLVPGGRASIFDLRREASRAEVETLVGEMGLSGFDAWWTRQTFRFFLLPNAYRREDAERVAASSRFGGCALRLRGVEMEMRLEAHGRHHQADGPAVRREPLAVG